jgi:hypothetical protein
MATFLEGSTSFSLQQTVIVLDRVIAGDLKRAIY